MPFSDLNLAIPSPRQVEDSWRERQSRQEKVLAQEAELEARARDERAIQIMQRERTIIQQREKQEAKLKRIRADMGKGGSGSVYGSSAGNSISPKGSSYFASVTPKGSHATPASQKEALQYPVDTPRDNNNYENREAHEGQEFEVAEQEVTERISAMKSGDNDNIYESNNYESKYYDFTG